jgi:hypothetical protein
MSTGLRRRGDVDYAPPRHDAYVVLLIISLVAMILGCALLWLDYSSYPDTKAPTVSVRQAAPPGGPGPGGAGAGGAQGGPGAGGAEGGAGGAQKQ